MWKTGPKLKEGFEWNTMVKMRTNDIRVRTERITRQIEYRQEKLPA